MTEAVLARIHALHSKFAELVVGLLTFFAATYKTVFDFDAPVRYSCVYFRNGLLRARQPLHDPCAVAFVIAPELFTTRLMRVDIETSSPLSAGQTACHAAIIHTLSASVGLRLLRPRPAAERAQECPRGARCRRAALLGPDA